MAFVFVLELASGGTWVAQSARCLTLDFCSGYHLRVVGLSSELGSELSSKLAWDSLSLSLPLCSSAYSLSKINKENLRKKKRAST